MVVANRKLSCAYARSRRRVDDADDTVFSKKSLFAAKFRLRMFLSPIRRLASTAGGASFRAPVITVFSGSSREGSLNTKLAKTAEKAADSLGANTKFIDLGSYDLPLYSEDIESSAGLPSGAMELKSELADSDGWIIACPEYNGSITPLLLNAVTWCSRGDPAGEMYATFKGKCAIVISASPGAMGGMRSLNPSRQLLQNLGVNVLPSSVAVGGAFMAFDESTGDLINEKQKGMLDNAVNSLFFLARQEANKEAACKVIEAHIVGQYGSVDVS